MSALGWAPTPETGGTLRRPGVIAGGRRGLSRRAGRVPGEKPGQPTTRGPLRRADRATPWGTAWREPADPSERAAEADGAWFLLADLDEAQ